MFLPADKRYWAKDVVFLVSSEGELGVQAWLSEYTGEKIRGTVQFSYKYIDLIAYIIQYIHCMPTTSEL